MSIRGVRSVAGAALIALLLAWPAAAQESQFAADLRREREKVAESCGSFSVKALGGCAYTVITESPIHLAFGSIAPQNGFAFGLALAEHYTPNESWRLSWNADAVSTLGGSWRGGAYMKIVRTPATSGVVVRQPGSAPPSGRIAPRDFAVGDLFAQAVSLGTVSYFGPGPKTFESGRSVFGERQVVVGGSLIYPIRAAALASLRPSLLGGVSGRFVNIRSSSSKDAPSTELVYNDLSAPGLAKQSGFVQVREGIRLKPSLSNGWLHFDYMLGAQQFRTAADSHSSFNRWTMDLRHEVPLYRSGASSGAREFNGPDDCAESSSSSACPGVEWSRNREGTVTFRLLTAALKALDGSRVPFYFEPTLGGSDINGERMLAGFQDYRFRAPNLLLWQESIEHSVWGPIGAFALFEQGAVGERFRDVGSSNLVSSVSIGATLRAGGFPLAIVSYSHGREGSHFIASISSTLLGGSARPRLD